MAAGDTISNAFKGAVATVVLTPFVPFAPVGGGAVAGYLHGGTGGDGLRVGAISGAIAFIPAIVFGYLVISIMSAILGGIGGPSGLLGAVGTFAIVLVLIVAAVYVIGLSLLGGWIGSYLTSESHT